LPNYRNKQIKKTIFSGEVSSFLDISNIPLDLRIILNDELKIIPFEVSEVLISQDKRAIKALLMLEDKRTIETVLISPKPDTWSACISSQVGCSLGCLFCATGRGGFKRNLTVDEITSQVLFWRRYLKINKIKGTFSNIVYMGMGEPFLNWENVKESIKELTNEDLFNFGNRSISVSTAGIPDKIEEFSNEFPQANLALSLHFADDLKRSHFMKVNRQYNLEKLSEVLQKYLIRNKRKVFIEYILLENINDSPSDARNLIKFLRKIGNQKLLHVNLIRYNSIGFGLNPSSREITKKFKFLLEKERVACTIRKSLGEDIQGACGQLAGTSN
jgi:adenine C2-methylase RlmN of 23S rRNA A2503 and tRNA A37